MILVTGGAGYIGSHTCVELLEAGYEIAVLDNFSNSKPEALSRIKEITGKDFPFYEVDLLDLEGVNRVFEEQKEITAVIHFAGLKAVGESCEQPLRYYHNNLTGTLHLCEAMQAHGVKSMIFSSSATVYGDPASVPIREDFPLSTTNPYGTTKLMIERILTDLQKADPEWNVVLLRYFNPVGAHASGLLGEDPNGIPNNLTPYIAKVATGELPFVRVFGDDYPTPDGTGVRDYIHVVDLAKGHIKALKKSEPGVHIYNLGTGIGYSVLDVIHAYEAACGKELAYQIVGRRAGDIAECYADPSKAEKELGWKAEKSLRDMCADSWNYMMKNR